MTLNPYMACTQVNIHQSDKQEDKSPDQQNRGNSSDKNVTDGRQGYVSRYEATENNVM